MLRHMIFSGYANMKDKIRGYQNGIFLLNGAAKIQTFKLLTLDRWNFFRVDKYEQKKFFWHKLREPK